ncbi:tRNA (adenine(22)-N(1))-methyltransferase [Bacillus marinisedimentorum]|uniref:tRNA (adenine(22)-N(1))-methyltransferase n=1 Tax=Bacillus marinisedimentorum TaxID=1821260 RepID=UPI0008725DD7|nr:tRNA (adenine(22)-N(1))-methyltransferase TrmK [Bacillus marinisedimentorum]
MNELQLSTRLKKVAEWVPEGARLADIGSDHAYLPTYLALGAKIEKGIAGEVADGPLRSAREQIRKTGLQDLVEARKGNGLDVVETGEVNAVTIAGMGGLLIRDILDAGIDKLDSVERLILQPNVGAVNIRIWLADKGWTLIDEVILEEEDKVYEILVAEKGDPDKPYQGVDRKKALFLGPYLMRRNDKAFRKKWQRELLEWERVLQQLKQASRQEDVAAKKQVLQWKIDTVKEALL